MPQFGQYQEEGCQISEPFIRLTTAEICHRLEEIGISCDRRTLSKDIALLNEYGYEIMDEMKGHEKGYYVVDRSFSVPELKVMMDAVHGASFITEKKADELISKIASLGGSHQTELLKRNQTCFNTHRHSTKPSTTPSMLVSMLCSNSADWHFTIST